MKTVFLVIGEDNNPMMVCESRADASSIVSSTLNKKSFKAQQEHIKELSYIRDSRHYTLSENDLKQLVKNAVKTALRLASTSSSRDVIEFPTSLDAENFDE